MGIRTVFGELERVRVAYVEAIAHCEAMPAGTTVEEILAHDKLRETRLAYAKEIVRLRKLCDEASR